MARRQAEGRIVFSGEQDIERLSQEILRQFKEIQEGGEDLADSTAGVGASLLTAGESAALFTAGLEAALSIAERIVDTVQAMAEKLGEAGQSNELERNFNRQIESAGKSLEQLREASRNTLDDDALRRYGIAAKNAGISVEQLAGVMDVAFRGAASQGLEFAETFEVLFQDGVIGGSASAYELLGIVADTGEVTEEWAKANGKAVDSLSRADETAAMLSFTLGQVSRDLGVVNQMGAENINTFAVLGTQLKNLEQEALRNFAFIVTDVSKRLGIIENNTSKGIGAFRELQAVMADHQLSAQAKATISELTDGALDSAEGFTKVRMAVQKFKAELRDPEVMRQFQGQLRDQVIAEADLMTFAFIEAGQSSDYLRSEMLRLADGYGLAEEATRGMNAELARQANAHFLVAKAAAEQRYQQELADAKERHAARQRLEELIARAKYEQQQLGGGGGGGSRRRREERVDSAAILAGTRSLSASQRSIGAQSDQDVFDAMDADPFFGEAADAQRMAYLGQVDEEALQAQLQAREAQIQAEMRFAEALTSASEAARGLEDALGGIAGLDLTAGLAGAQQHLGEITAAIKAFGDTSDKNAGNFVANTGKLLQSSGALAAGFVKDERAKAAIMGATELAAVFASYPDVMGMTMHGIASGMYFAIAAGAGGSSGAGAAARGGAGRRQFRTPQIGPAGQSEGRGGGNTYNYHLSGSTIFGSNEDKVSRDLARLNDQEREARGVASTDAFYPS